MNASANVAVRTVRKTTIGSVFLRGWITIALAARLSTSTWTRWRSGISASRWVSLEEGDESLSPEPRCLEGITGPLGAAEE